MDNFKPIIERINMINKPQTNTNQMKTQKGWKWSAYMLLSLLSLTFISSIVFAQNNENVRQLKANETFNFSLQQCIDFAYQNQVDVVNVQLDEKIAKGKINEIAGTGLPQINASFDLKDFLAIPTSLIPAEFFGGKKGEFIAVKFGTQYNATADISASQLLFDGTYLVGLKASKTYFELSQKNTTRTKIETAATVTKAYYATLIAAEKINLIDANISRVKKLLDDTKAMYDNGFVEKIDLDRITVAYNNITVEKEKVTRYIVLSYNLLKFQIGMSQSAVLILTDNLNNWDVANWDIKTDGFDCKNRIEFSLMDVQKRLALLDLKRYKSGYYPSLFAYGDFNYAQLSNSIELTNAHVKWYPTGLIGAKLTLPILDGLQKNARIVQAKLNLKKVENQQESLENSLTFQMNSAKTTYDNSVSSLKVQKDNIKLAENIYNVSKKKYDQGVGSNLEVITAQTVLKEAQDNYYGALFDALNAKVDLDKALGNIK